MVDEERWSDEDAGAALDVDGEDVRAVREAMQGKYLDGWRLVDWERENPKREREDDSTERVRRYREKVRENGGTVGGYLRHHAVLMERDGGRCVYCETTENLCIDHLTPVQQGGTDDIGNLAIACRRCNSGKSGRTPEEAGYIIRCHAASVAYAAWLALSRPVTPSHPLPRTDKKRVEEKRRDPSPTGKDSPPEEARSAPDPAENLVGWWVKRQEEHGSRPPDTEIAKQGRAAKDICRDRNRDDIRKAIRGMSNLFKYSNGQPWDLLDLRREFQKALEAADAKPVSNGKAPGDTPPVYIPPPSKF